MSNDPIDSLPEQLRMVCKICNATPEAVKRALATFGSERKVIGFYLSKMVHDRAMVEYLIESGKFMNMNEEEVVKFLKQAAIMNYEAGNLKPWSAPLQQWPIPNRGRKWRFRRKLNLTPWLNK